MIMKRKVLYVSAFMLSITGSMYAQGEMDAYKLSQTDLLGTARSVGMGGAVGAMGGDVSAIAVNPAGIGYFTTSQVVTTLNFQSVNTKSNLNAGDMKEDKFKFNFNNLAFVGTFPIDSDVAPLLNFGFSFNRLKNFDRKYGVSGNNVRSLSGYMASRANLDGNIGPSSDLDLNNNPFGKYDWMAVFGFNSGLIGLDSNNQFVSNYPGGAGTYSDLFVEEKGYVDSYDFNFGTTINEIISLGLTVSVTDIDYRRYSYYSESYDAAGDKGFYIANGLKTEGTGVQFAAGIIVQPIPEFRFGLAYHSPTWYNLTDYYDAEMDYSTAKGSDFISSRDGRYGDAVDYDMRTPDKFTFSATGMIGPVLLSADYEFTNYKSNMRYSGDYGSKDGVNADIKEDFKGASAVRVGAEISFTKQFTGRLGYAWKQSPLKKGLKDGSRPAVTVGSDSQYVLDDDTHNITWGLGYRFTKNIFADIAFIYKMQNADLYSFAGSDKATMKTNAFNGMMTVGYRF